MPVWKDKTLWTPEEMELRKCVQLLFKSNYSRDEIRFLVDKSLFALCLCDWKMTDIEARPLLEMCKPAYTKARDSFCFHRERVEPGMDEERSAYFRNKILPQRELLRKQMELQRMRANLALNEAEKRAIKEMEREGDDSLCADQRV